SRLWRCCGPGPGRAAKRPPSRCGRAVWAVWALVMVVPVMVRVMVLLPGGGAAGFEELGQGGGLAGLPAAELVDDDDVLGAVGWLVVVGERQVVGLGRFGQVLLSRPRAGARGRGVLAPGAVCLAAGGHWP